MLKLSICLNIGVAHVRLKSSRPKVSQVEKRLIPAFEAHFPNRQLVLLIDNASYQHALDETFVNPTSMSRKEMINVLCHAAFIGGVRVERGNSTITLDISKVCATQSDGLNTPTKFELHKKLEEFLFT